jgi:hypothetical protein
MNVLSFAKKFLLSWTLCFLSEGEIAKQLQRPHTDCCCPVPADELAGMFVYSPKRSLFLDASK